MKTVFLWINSSNSKILNSVESILDKILANSDEVIVFELIVCNSIEPLLESFWDKLSSEMLRELSIDCVCLFY